MPSADWIAAGAAILAAGVVAWQSLETRRSAKASAKAAEAANTGLEYSKSALELARREESNTRRLIDEAVKTRIDEVTPTLTIILGGLVGPLQPDLVDATQLVFTGGDEVYRMPKHQDSILAMRQFFTLISDGKRIMMVHMPPWTPDWDEEQYPDTTLTSRSGLLEMPVGVRIDGFFDVKRTIADWIKITESTPENPSLPAAEFVIGYNDPSDTGATDHYPILVGGSPLKPVPDELGAWTATSSAGDAVHPQMTVTRMPRKRDYYLSKTENKKLGE
ncbi:hypothetical protein ACFVWG_07855 [Kribbella sp. NPDC058245]|uniref:hypothetical protein n=1 Tax=Kribbella sp. NPDC058245 TaxID=3346399 RepID=UPI0036EF95DD